MKLLVTLGYISNHCKDWGVFCEDTGFDYYCLSYGGHDDEISISIEQAIKWGLLNKSMFD